MQTRKLLFLCGGFAFGFRFLGFRFFSSPIILMVPIHTRRRTIIRGIKARTFKDNPHGCVDLAESLFFALRAHGQGVIRELLANIKLYSAVRATISVNWHRLSALPLDNSFVNQRDYSAPVIPWQGNPGATGGISNKTLTFFLFTSTFPPLTFRGHPSDNLNHPACKTWILQASFAFFSARQAPVTPPRPAPPFPSQTHKRPEPGLP